LLYFADRSIGRSGESKSLKYEVATCLDCKDHHKFYSDWKPLLLADKEAETPSRTDAVPKSEAKSMTGLPLLQHCQQEAEVKEKTNKRIN
jgi:hypothetical protein